MSWERILSGSGLGNLYDFFRQAKGIDETRENAEAIAASSDRNATISAARRGGQERGGGARARSSSRRSTGPKPATSP